MAQQTILRVRFRGPDMDFVKAIAFEPNEPISSVLGKIDRVRVAAGWSEDKPQSAFGLIRIPEKTQLGLDVFWLDASSAPLSSVQLRDRELLEYRELARQLRIVRRDGLENCKIDVNEHDTIGDMLRAILQSAPSSIVQIESATALRGVVRLDKVQVNRMLCLVLCLFRSIHQTNNIT